MTQWLAPRDEHRNGQVLGYILRYRLHGYNNAPWSSRNITNEVRGVERGRRGREE